MNVGGVDPEALINLAKASVVVIDSSHHSLELTAQILKGFGVGAVRRFDSLSEANGFARYNTFELLLIDPGIEDGGGYQFVRDLRRSGSRNAFVPTILTCGHVRKR